MISRYTLIEAHNTSKPIHITFNVKAIYVLLIFVYYCNFNFAILIKSLTLACILAHILFPQYFHNFIKSRL